jgi:hypothetical protein
MISQDVVEWGKPLQQAVRETPTPHVGLDRCHGCWRARTNGHCYA